MWTIDYALQLASVNYSSAYIHTREAGITYNLFDPPAKDSWKGGWTTGPPYYALLVVAEALRSSSGTVVVDLDVDSSKTSNLSSVAGYGIYENGTPQKLVLFNFGPQAATFNLPNGTTTHNTSAVRYLTAPGVTDKSAITWDGTAVDGSGILQGKNTTLNVQCDQGCTLNVPAPGVALVYLDSSQAISYSTLAMNHASSIANAHWTFLVTLVLCLLIIL